MTSELTNLLPGSSVRAFRKNYFLRLATVVVCLLVLLVIILAVLLIPSYMYAREEVKSQAATLDHVSQTLATTQAQQVQAQLISLQTEAGILTKLTSTAKASGTIRAVLAVARPGIALTGFAFTPPLNATPGTLQVSGVASTREQLSSYDQALGTLSFVTSANLPISDYAQESNIPFTITLTGSLSP